MRGWVPLILQRRSGSASRIVDVVFAGALGSVPGVMEKYGECGDSQLSKVFTT